MGLPRHFFGTDFARLYRRMRMESHIIGTEASNRKKPFVIDEVMRRIRAAVKSYDAAAMFVLAEEGFDSVFQILVACIISIRTFEEVTLPTARKLFAAAPTPK